MISFIKNRNLKAKLYREETLTLSKLREIVSLYHDKQALILSPESHVNKINADYKGDGLAKLKGWCWKCDKIGHQSKDSRISRNHKCERCGTMGHFKACCHSQKTLTASQSHSPYHGREHRREKTMSKEKDIRKDRKRSRQSLKTQSLTVQHWVRTSTCSTPHPLRIQAIWNYIEDKPISVIIDSGASCNLMSEEVFKYVTGGKVSLYECNKRVHAYTYTKPLHLNGMCSLQVCVPQTKMSRPTQFFIVPGKTATLLGRETSQSLNILRIGVSIIAVSS